MRDSIVGMGLLLGILLAGASAAEEIAPGILRTPDAAFDGITDFPYEPRYTTINGLRIHYVDEGPRDAAPILLIHGEPTWSYLFRKMIPVLTAAGHRVIAPDLPGFGRSDKYVDPEDYSYVFQVETMRALVRELDLQDATFFGQDWGGLIGLRVVGAEPERFARVVVSNTGMPSAGGLGGLVGYPMFKALVWWQGDVTFEELAEDITFPRWVAYATTTPELDVARVMGFLGGDGAAAEAYEAPFPDARYKAAAQIMPYLVPSQLSENEAVWREVYENWDKPFLVAFTDGDPITAGGEQVFLERIPTAQQVTIHGAGHFVQEDAGPELAALINAFIAGEALESIRVEP